MNFFYEFLVTFYKNLGNISAVYLRFYSFYKEKCVEIILLFFNSIASFAGRKPNKTKSFPCYIPYIGNIKRSPVANTIPILI